MISRSSSKRGKPSLPLTVAALLGVAALGLAAIWYGTMGFRVISTEDGRRLAIEEQPRVLPLPAVAGPAIRGAVEADRRTIIATFFYARCNAVCSSVGTELQQMQQKIVARGLQDRVRLLSISFDPRDNNAALAHYAQRMHADPLVWRMTALPDAQRQKVLDLAGVVVLPAPLGEYEHNAAFHLIDAGGKLVRIVDYEQPDAALDAALAMSSGPGVQLAHAAHAAGARQ
jgi:protein SCO1/2